MPLALAAHWGQIRFIRWSLPALCCLRCDRYFQPTKAARYLSVALERVSNGHQAIANEIALAPIYSQKQLGCLRGVAMACSGLHGR